MALDGTIIRAVHDVQGLKPKWSRTAPAQSTAAPIYTEALDRFGALYGIEREAHGQTLNNAELSGMMGPSRSLISMSPPWGLVAAGDSAYNDIHLYLGDSKGISALGKIESLNRRAVVSAHKGSENDGNPQIIEQTPAMHLRFRPVGGNYDRCSRAL